MLMRILIPFIIPNEKVRSHIIYTTWVDLKDYFLYPEKIKKITPFAGV